MCETESFNLSSRKSHVAFNRWLNDPRRYTTEYLINEKYNPDVSCYAKLSRVKEHDLRNQLYLDQLWNIHSSHYLWELTRIEIYFKIMHFAKLLFFIFIWNTIFLSVRSPSSVVRSYNPLLAYIMLYIDAFLLFSRINLVKKRKDC